MKFLYFRFCVLFLCFFSLKINSQETLPIYQDYLSDNVYLVHPSAAGIGNSSKLRFTARQQWAGIPNAPALQTLSFHTKISEESNAGYGFVLFNDKNGFHSQKGIQGSYAYHLPMSDGRLFNQLSFGLAFTFVQNQSDQRTFTGDRAIAAVVESTSYYNADFSVAYHLGGFSSYFTVKNLLLTAKNNLNVQEPLDLRNYIFSTGYYFGQDLFVQFEPSLMLQIRESTGERIADFNMKVYKDFSKLQLWAALSYRKNFDVNAIENAQFVSPIIGLNYDNLMFSYTYTNQMNETVLTTSGFHQISVGINLWTREQRAAACPNINSSVRRF
ncbi:MAG: type IX secretion system membrane protein PorP/SprF [Polaribacter sp.]|jgi:type IX secretion system PorP/SprF family membrane protein|uniref:PorP/SprF family type IX secretion system membrane protein n=1 Tax=Polaribacter sp. TaxID=1920175 RepID=UPI002628937B|nr:type IX secretion system membrane protein PorP/SprF [Polaribacter sp.]MBT3742929.1 type IX secretion system membrane protein PorP/SprF [Polaribacter sp.]MBT4414360.1 type IX secretion system membrane protein PorP/SprF [Polaribacter sp.]MBT7815188.1 type IX secretion system membrane protein PorP/SprF [Polaribacter sp.]MDG1195498.1 type IX secretion system membrane protein PorP/SprF [Polaribacter sp.]MDG1404081.1 type IX secretion system membrane protein PorP/SprF [Polaribacter sp.]